MRDPVITLAAVKALRGNFKRSPTEFIAPVLYAALLIVMPAAMIHVRSVGEVGGPPVVSGFMRFAFYVVLPAFGLFVLCRSTAQFKFDGSSVSCRWLGRFTTWEEKVDQLTEVVEVPGVKGNLPSLLMYWQNNGTSVTLTRDLREALQQ